MVIRTNAQHIYRFASRKKYIVSFRHNDGEFRVGDGRNMDGVRVCFRHSARSQCDACVFAGFYKIH